MRYRRAAVRSNEARRTDLSDQLGGVGATLFAAAVGAQVSCAGVGGQTRWATAPAIGQKGGCLGCGSGRGGLVCERVPAWEGEELVYVGDGSPRWRGISQRVIQSFTKEKSRGCLFTESIRFAGRKKGSKIYTCL